MLNLVTSGEEASGPSSGTAPRKDSTSKKRKRTLRTMEDEEMYRKLRDGKPVERNTRQQNELVQLQKGMCLFVCLFVAFFKPYTHLFFFFFLIRSSRLSLFVTDGQIGTVKLVTTIRGIIEFLQNLGKFYQAFSVHLKHQLSEQHTLKEAHEMVKGVSAYFKSAVDEVKSTINSNRVTMHWSRGHHLHQNCNFT